MKRTIVLGGPGAGKTENLIGRMELMLENGVDPERIAFVSFTNEAVDEARRRACERFQLEPEDLPHFRTLHSLSFRALGMKRNEVIDEGHLKEFGQLVGELLEGDHRNPLELGNDGPIRSFRRNADPMLTLDHYARATLKGLKTAWEDHGGQIGWFRLKRFSDAYNFFKQDHGLYDFTDMLSRYVAEPTSPLNVDHAIVDEAQDLTQLQWQVATKAFANAESLTIAGDDDQSIHRWAGSAEDFFRELPGDRVILEKSHRLPKAIFDLSQSIIKQVRKRIPKMQQTDKAGGSVKRILSIREVDLSHGSWLLLARTRSQLSALAKTAREQAVVYSVKGRSSVKDNDLTAILSYEALRAGKAIGADEASLVMKMCGKPMELEDRDYRAFELGFTVMPIWHDALIRMPLEDREYYLSCLRKGEKLGKPPRVRIETIHGSKGLEAESVCLCTDLTKRTYDGYWKDRDSEHRVFYVGATRALTNLFLVASHKPRRFLI